MKTITLSEIEVSRIRDLIKQNIKKVSRQINQGIPGSLITESRIKELYQLKDLLSHF